MATSKSWAQNAIICDHCHMSAQQFCNGCQVNLCVVCISKHVEKLPYVSHDIVPFRNRKTQIVFPLCKFHPSQRCEVHCKKCQTPICIMCCIGYHKRHSAVELVEFFETKKQEIQMETREIENSLIPSYSERDVYMNDQISKITAELSKVEKEKARLEKLWHKEVDTIFHKFGSVIYSLKDSNLRTAITHQTKIKDLIKDMIQTVHQNKQILESKSALDVTNYKSKLHEFRNALTDVDFEIPSLIKTTVKGRKLGFEFGELEASLRQTYPSFLSADDPYQSRRMLFTSETVDVVPTVYKSLYYMSCFGEHQAWISGNNKTITRIDIHGYVKETVVTNCRFWPNGIAVTGQGELIYSDCNRRKVNIVRYGKVETLITTPRGWKPHRLCYTRSGDILVGVSHSRKKKIIRYHEMKISQNIERNEHGKPIFKNGFHVLCLTENINGDICVCDRNADSVVVLNMSGRVRFRYYVTPTWKPFKPKCLVTDSLGQIIVTDSNNSCIHIIDQNGHFLTTIKDLELYNPHGLSIDSEWRLWVGLHWTGEIKLLDYMTKHIQK